MSSHHEGLVTPYQEEDDDTTAASTPSGAGSWHIHPSLNGTQKFHSHRLLSSRIGSGRKNQHKKKNCHLLKALWITEKVSGLDLSIQICPTNHPLPTSRQCLLFPVSVVLSNWICGFKVTHWNFPCGFIISGFFFFFFIKRRWMSK